MSIKNQLFYFTSLLFFSIFLVTNTARAAEENKPDACFALLEACTLATETALQQLAECKELRECKQEAGIDKGSCKVDAKEAKNTCLAVCGNLSGKAKRQCKKDCNRVFRTAKSACRNVKDSDILECKKQYKTPECQAARSQRITQFLNKLPACLNYENCMNNIEEALGGTKK